MFLEREVREKKKGSLLRRPYLPHLLSDLTRIRIYCSPHWPLYSHHWVLFHWFLFKRNGPKKFFGKTLCRAVIIARHFLLLPLLDHAKIRICGAPICPFDSKRWRLETNTLTRVNSSNIVNFKSVQFVFDP